MSDGNVIELAGQMKDRAYALAVKRQAAAIARAVARARERKKDVEQARMKAEKKNWLPNHVKGTAAEFAVSEWLKQNGVACVSNFEDVERDLDGAPDVLIGDARIKTDVKAMDYEFPESQIWNIDQKQIVVWCQVDEQEDGFVTVLYRVTQGDPRASRWRPGPSVTTSSVRTIGSTSHAWRTPSRA